MRKNREARKEGVEMKKEVERRVKRSGIDFQLIPESHSRLLKKKRAMKISGEFIFTTFSREKRGVPSTLMVSEEMHVVSFFQKSLPYFHFQNLEPAKLQ